MPSRRCRSVASSLLVLAFASPAGAQPRHPHASHHHHAPRPRGSHAPAATPPSDPPSTPAIPLFDRVTFSPGPAPLEGITFTPEPPHTPPASAPPGAPSDPVAVAVTVTAPDPLPLASPPAPALPEPSPAPAAVAAPAEAPVPSEPTAPAPPAAVAPAPPVAPAGSTEAYGCALDGPIAHVALATPDGARPVQVALATRGREAVAFVTLARPATAREWRSGLRFDSARLVRIAPDAATLAVDQPAPGFEPDASVALGPRGEVFVAGYTRLDPHADPSAPAPALRVALLDGHGHATAGPSTVDATAGLAIDSPVVAFRDAFAVVLGRGASTPASAVDGAARGPVHEALYVFARDGALVRGPLAVTDAQSDDTIGRYRVGLGAVTGGEELAVSWTVAAGDQAGVWSRRFDGTALGPPTRLARRAAWGSEIARDGSGVLFRTGGELGAPVRLAYVPWRGGEPFALGSGWDPSTAFVRGRVLVAGATLEGEGGRGTVDALFAVTEPSRAPRAITTPGVAPGALASAVDVDLAATDDGAVAAWIEPTREDDDSAPRRLAVARVVCR